MLEGECFGEVAGVFFSSAQKGKNVTWPARFRLALTRQERVKEVEVPYARTIFITGPRPLTRETPGRIAWILPISGFSTAMVTMAIVTATIIEIHVGSVLALEHILLRLLLLTKDREVRNILQCSW